MSDLIRKQFSDLLGEACVLIDEPMNKHTTFRIGGTVPYFVTPRSAGQVQGILSVCREHALPWFVMGNGSNLLVGDDGWNGVIIQIGREMSRIEVEDDRITAGAGAPLSAISAAAKNASLTGLEFAGGIPGTLGGAVFMNAGAYGGELKDVLVDVTVLDEQGDLRVIPKEELAMGYRTSVIRTAGYLVLEARLKLVSGEQEKIVARMQELKEQRSAKQPLEYPSAGSTFKRPEGYFAGKLIMDSGLRGYRVGGAQVSEKHCGFVINTGGASAADVCRLMADVISCVREKYGVTLEPEVRFLGTDLPR